MSPAEPEGSSSTQVTGGAITEHITGYPERGSVYQISAHTVTMASQHTHTGPRCPIVMRSSAGPTVLTRLEKWSQLLRKVGAHVM